MRVTLHWNFFLKSLILSVKEKGRNYSSLATEQSFERFKGI